MKETNQNIWHLSGVTHPERATLNITPVHIERRGGDAPDFSLDFRIDCSQVSGRIQTDADIYTAKNIAFWYISSVVNTFGFVMGYGYSVEIVKAVHEATSETIIFGIGVPCLAPQKDEDTALVFLNLLPLLNGQGVDLIVRCLQDFNSAIRFAEDTPFYCFRSIEALKQHVGLLDNIVDEKQQWIKLAAYVGKTKSDIDKLAKKASMLRHGNTEAVSDADRQDIFLFARDVIQAYFQVRLASLPILVTKPSDEPS